MAGIAPDPQPAPDQAPQDQQQPQGAGPAEVGDEEGLAPNASPEEQAQYEDFVHASLALIYDKKGDQGIVRPGILKLLDDDPSDLKGILNAKELDQFSPLVAIAATAVLITIEIQKLAGDEKPADDIVMHGGAAIIEELCEIWMRRNKKQLGEDDIHRCLSMAMDIYREVAADQGLIDLNALKDEFGKLVQADKAGKLAEVSPDLAGINQAAQINMDQGDDPNQPDAQQPDQAAQDQQASQDQPPPDEEQPK